MSDLGNNTYWNEQDASNNAAVPNGWPEGMAPSGVNNSARADKGALKRFWNRNNSTKTTSGSLSVYTLTYDVAAASLYDGEEHSFVLHTTCGANPTLNINGLGAKNIRKLVVTTWTNLAAGDVVTGQPLRVRYNLADDKFDIIPPVVTTAPTKAPGDNTTAVATTAFVTAAVATGVASVTIRTYVQTFTTSGTYTPHAGLLNCIIECVGGGGGGGGAAASSAPGGVPGHGGGGGGYSRKLCTAADIGGSKAVTIGAGGAGGAAGANAGSAGGDTSVGALCIAKGGSGGSGAGIAGVGGAGGIAGTGDISLPGARGGNGAYSINLTSVAGYGGYGGASGGGFGASTGNAATLNVQTDGATGLNYGGGGAGGLSANGGGTAAGGAGASGVVIITEFCNQ